MVILDNSASYPARRRFGHVTLASVVGVAALGVALVSFATRGFSDNGLRLASEMTWRFDCLVLFAALVTGPLGRLVPGLGVLARQGRPLLQGFCAGVAVYLAVILLPNLVAVPDGVRSAGVTPGMTVFILFTGAVTLVLAAATHQPLCDRVGRQACRTLLGISVIYFWLCYTLIGLSHLSGPHRPDAFYDVSVSLMLLALLMRFADRFMASRRPAQVPI